MHPPLGLPEDPPDPVRWTEAGARYRLRDRLHRLKILAIVVLATASVLVAAFADLAIASWVVPLRFGSLALALALVVWVLRMASRRHFAPTVELSPEGLSAPGLEVPWRELGLVHADERGTLYIEWRDDAGLHRRSVAYDLPDRDAKWLVRAIRSQQDRVQRGG